MTVIAFPDRRSSGTDDGRVCRCGSSWFDLMRVDPDGREVPGSVLLSREGRVVGYSGVPRCHDCGQRY